MRAHELRGAIARYALTIGSALIIAEFSVELWFTSGLALQANTLDPAVARTAADLALMFGPVLTVADVHRRRSDSTCSQGRSLPALAGFPRGDIRLA